MKTAVRVLFCAATLLILRGDAAAQEIERKAMLVEGTGSIRLRVLARTGARLYAVPRDGGEHIDTGRDVALFETFFVYGIEEGWYEVGTEVGGGAIGWLKASEAVPLKTNLVLAFEAKRAGRERLLMFADRKELRHLATSPMAKRRAAAANRGNLTVIEPELEVDIHEAFYLIPVIDHLTVEIDGAECRLLKVAIATTHGADRDPGAAADVPEDMGIDIVFVTDLTTSMQPYYTAVFRALREIAENEIPDNRVRFGFWGFRDSLENPGMEFVTRNFTPELLPLEGFLKAVSSARDCRHGSGGYAEDVYAGVHAGLTQTAWTRDAKGGRGALRFLILIGDAPAHEPGDPWNSTNLSAETLATLAEEMAVYTFALLLTDPEAAMYHTLAESQFRTLARNRSEPAAGSYTAVDTRDPALLGQIAGSIVTDILSTLEWAVKRQGPARSSELGRAALQRYLGTRGGAKVPDGVLGWIADRDLLNPDLMTVEPRVLLEKIELSEFREKLKELFRGLRDAEISSGAFFRELQREVAGLFVAQGPDDGSPLADLLELLPYRSRVLTMTEETWSAMSADAQQQFVDEVQAKMEFYKAVYDGFELWSQLGPDDEPGNFVCPIPLDMLP